MKNFLKRIIPQSLLDLIGSYLYLKNTGGILVRPLRDAGALIRWYWHIVTGTDIRFNTPDGTRFVSMPKNYSSFVVSFRDFRDPSIHAFMKRRLHDGSVFVDAGANIGTYAIRAGQLVGPSGTVLAVEAHPRTYRYLTQNIALNNLHNVTPVPVALGAQSGSITISFTESNAGETHISTAETDGVTIPMKTLDALLEETHMHTVDYLKIDVEGFEFPLLQGAHRTIEQNEAIVVQTELIESHAQRYGHSITEISDYLHALGLSPHSVDELGNAHTVDSRHMNGMDILWYRR